VSSAEEVVKVEFTAKLIFRLSLTYLVHFITHQEKGSGSVQISLHGSMHFIKTQ